MSKVNVLLTEIALHLLGNQFYDIDGKPVDELQMLYRGEDGEIAKNRSHLSEVLGIYNYEQNSDSTTSAAAAASPALSTDDDDIVPIEANHNNVIVLDDDDDEEYEASSQTSATEAEEFMTTSSISNQSLQISNNLSTTEESPILFSLINSKNSSNVDKFIQNVKDASKSSAISEGGGNASMTLSSNEPNNLYLSDKLEDRLGYIGSETETEYKRMKLISATLKNKYIANAANQTALTTADQESVDRFFAQQKQELFNESNVLMQFIRVVKTNDWKNHVLITRVGKDILAAKDKML